MIHKKLIDSLHKEPRIVGSFPDPLLVEVFKDDDLLENARNAVVAELWLRRWLYQKICPAVILNCIADGTSRGQPGFRIHFQEYFSELILPLRSAPTPEKSMPGRLQDERERDIWDFLTARVQAFVSADGIFPIVPPKHSRDDAVAVPFRILPSGRTVPEDNSADLWDSALVELRKSYHLDMPIRFDVAFPDDDKPDGKSLGLPILLARERLGGRLPWFSPLGILATGRIAEDRVWAVDGVEAKQALACRMGCNLFIAPQASSAPDVVSFAVGALRKDVLSAIRSAYPPVSYSQQIACDILSRCRDELKAATNSYPMHRLRELDKVMVGVRRFFTHEHPGTSDATVSRIVSDKIQSLLGGSFRFQRDRADIDREILSVYREKPLHGRAPLVAEIGRFLEREAGGLLMVTGGPGYGKTALLAHCLERADTEMVWYHFFRAGMANLSETARFFTRLAEFLNKLLPEEFRCSPHQAEAEPRETVHYLLNCYSGLRDMAPAEAVKPLLIIIDGIDEASEPYLAPFFPFTKSDWPTSLRVIVSARTPFDNDLTKIKYWMELSGDKPIVLNRLDADTIKTWIKTSKSIDLINAVDNTDFVKLFSDKTNGCALYVEHLISRLEITDGISDRWRECLEILPDSYVEFVKLQYADVFERKIVGSTPDQLVAFRRLIEILVVAHDPLDTEDLRRVLGEGWLMPFKELPRWIAETKGQKGRGSLYTFTNPLIREALRAPGVDLPRQSAERSLVEYCLQWHKHGSPYALRHALTHLRESSRAEFFAIAADDNFLRAQAQLQGDDPHAILLPLQTALQVASQGEDVVNITRFSLKHAYHVAQLTRQTPLALLRSGNVDGAIKIVGTYENTEDQLLWYLLLAVESIFAGAISQAKYLLEERMPKDLLKSHVSRACEDQAAFVVRILLQSLDLSIGEGLMGVLRKEVQPRLGEEGRSFSIAFEQPLEYRTRLNSIALELRKRAPHSGARNWGVARVLEAIATALARKGETALARRVFSEAEKDIERMWARPWDRSWAWINLGEAQADARLVVEARKSFGEARNNAYRTKRPPKVARLLCEIACSQARTLSKEESLETFREAVNYIQQFPREHVADQFEAYGELLEAQCKSGFITLAFRTLASAEKRAANLEQFDHFAWEGLSKLALSLAKAMRYDRMFKRSAEDCASLSLRLFSASIAGGAEGVVTHKPHGLVNRVKALITAYEGRTDVALVEASRIKSLKLRSTAMRDIAIACISNGHFNDFKIAVARVTDRRSEVLPDIASELASRGEKEVFLRILWHCASYLDSNYRMLALLVRLLQPDTAALKTLLTILNDGRFLEKKPDAADGFDVSANSAIIEKL